MNAIKWKFEFIGVYRFIKDYNFKNADQCFLNIPKYIEGCDCLNSDGHPMWPSG